jgi:hypothetical protein
MRGSHSWYTTTGTIVATIVVLASLAGGAGAMAAQDDRTFEVALDAEGDAEITITSTFDLSDEDKRQAFRSLKNDEATREQYATDWNDQLSIVADNASELTGREMTVTNPTVTASTTDGGDTGVIALTIEWTNLAAVEGERLRVTEPFASGFTTDRQFSVVAPEGYELTGSEPTPETTDSTSAAYPPRTNLSGFQVTAAPTDDSTGDGSSIPGFGPAAGVIGVLLAVRQIMRRR